jgi:thioredoxin 1
LRYVPFMNSHHDKATITEAGELHFQSEVLSTTSTVLVAFCAPWSRPCQILEPVLEAVAASSPGSLKVLKVNVDDNLDLGIQYDIQSIPTLLCFVNGKVCARMVGTASKEAILSKVKPFIPSV